MPPELLLLAQIYTKSFGWGFAPDPTGEAYTAPPDLLAGLRGPTSKGRGEGKGRGGVLLLRGGEVRTEEREKRGGDGRGKAEKGGGREEGD